MPHRTIDEPGEDIRIDYPHRGNIRCRTLLIGTKGSVFGKVIADEVRVAGRLVGNAYAKSVKTTEGAFLCGHITASAWSIKPGTNLRGYMETDELPSDIGLIMADVVKDETSPAVFEVDASTEASVDTSASAEIPEIVTASPPETPRRRRGVMPSLV